MGGRVWCQIVSDRVLSSVGARTGSGMLPKDGKLALVAAVEIGAGMLEFAAGSCAGLTACWLLVNQPPIMLPVTPFAGGHSLALRRLLLRRQA